MRSNYIRALALRHATLEQRIEAELKAPLPDTLKVARLKKLRLACRDELRKAVSQQREKRNRRSNASPVALDRAPRALPPQLSDSN